MTATTTIILMLYFIRGSLGHVVPRSPIVGIKNGYSVEIEDAPYMVSLVEVDDHKEYLVCGGSIIHKQFVLTAAQCIIYRPISVRVGSTLLHDGGELLEVDRYIGHELYNKFNATEYDVALLKLSKRLTFGPSVNTIKLADYTVNIPTGLTANVTGWGGTEHSSESGYLQQVSVTVSPRELCDHQVNSPITLTDKQICVANQRKGFCMGDGGSPLSAGAGPLQIGIAIGGPTCVGLHNVYVKVAPHLLWIRNTIRQNL